MSRWEIRFKLALPLAAVGAVCLVLPAAEASASVPRMLGVNPKNDHARIVVRPRNVLTDSADGGLMRLHWTRWTTTVAKGYGPGIPRPRLLPDHGERQPCSQRRVHPDGHLHRYQRTSPRPLGHRAAPWAADLDESVVDE